jgi:drug/metabolite transporter (DMT)-like permease
MTKCAVRKAVPLVVVLTILWGSSWPLFPVAVREVSVWTFRSVSMVASAMALFLLARVRGDSLRIPRKHWGTIVAAALSYIVVWNVSSTFAAVLIPSGQAAILGYTMPIWTALLAWLVLGQRPTARVLLALVIGAAGVLLLVWDGSDAYARAPLGFALGLLAGVGWACGTLILKSRPVPVPPLVLTAWQVLVAAVPITVVAIALGSHQWFMPSTATIASIAYITLVPMALGNVAWFSIVGMLPANIAALSSVLVPVIAMVAGALVHHEPLGPVQWIAMACCTAGVVLVLQRRR